MTARELLDAIERAQWNAYSKADAVKKGVDLINQYVEEKIREAKELPRA